MARLSPAYLTPEPNQPLPLYEGPITLGTNPESGGIRFDWLPRPNVRFDVAQAAFRARTGNTTLAVPHANEPARALISNIRRGSNRATISGSLWGQLDLGAPASLSYVLFHVPNLTRYFTWRERVPPDQLTDDWEIDRMVMEAEGWRVIVEAVEDSDRLIEAVKSVGGYGITHVGKLERSDRSAFSVDEASELLDILTYLLSFARGFWVNTLLPLGFDPSGGRCWERWGPWRFDAWRYRPSWCDVHHGDSLALAFPGFLHRWKDQLWHEPIRLGVRWYIESNRGGGDIEASIILTQAALELLACTLLVEDMQLMSDKHFDNKLKAHDRIRETLQWAGIPTQLPASCTHLQQVGATEGWADGPRALTATRNWIGHPTRKNRAKFRMLSSQAIIEAWTLGVWYLELLLLRLINFNGPYSNRLTDDKWVGQVEPVPWATP